MAGLHLGRGVGVDHVAVVRGQLIVHRLWGMAEQVAVLVHGAALDRQVLAPQRDEGASRPGAPSTMTKSGRFSPAGIEVVEEPPPRRRALSAHAPVDSRIFRPSRRTPMAVSTEMFVAFLSSRVRITVPSRIRRTMSSSARLHVHHGSRFTFTFRHARLTTSVTGRALEQAEQRALHPPRVG